MSESWLNLEGKTVIVTGGASGIGKAVAQGFLNAGSNVVISDMAPEAPEMDEAAGKLLYVKTDVTKVADVEAMVEKAKEELMETAKAMAAKIISKGSYAVSVAKAAINNGYDMDIKNAVEMEANLFGVVNDTHDKKEGMGAFLEKRKADLTDF